MEAMLSCIDKGCFSYQVRLYGFKEIQYNL